MWNTGNRNTGNRNIGDCNIGDRNTGNRNIGDCNIGNRNTGNRNIGNWNTGSCNSGSFNTGNRNIGNRNTGDWNTGDRNTGSFNTVTPNTIRVFNKDCDRRVWNDATKPEFLYFNLTEVVDNMLVEYGYKEAFQKSWDKATEEDRALLFKLPNFDADIFYEISGIDVRNYKEKTELERKKEALIAKANKLLKQAEEL